MEKAAKTHRIQVMASLHAQIQRFVTVQAIAPSTLRGQPPKTRKVVHKFLHGIDLSVIPDRNPGFKKWLDSKIRQLRRRLPGPSKPWGIARKALNLFLRDCCYNHHLRSTFHLDRIEMLLEIPLDGVVGKTLEDVARDASKGEVPRWPGLKYLTRRDSKAFQACATALAKKMNLPAVVFLDNYLFLGQRSKQAAFRM